MLDYLLLGTLAVVVQITTYQFIRHVFFSREVIMYIAKILMQDIPGTSPAIKDPVEAYEEARWYNAKMKVFWWFWAGVSWTALIAVLLFRGIPG